jgi:hypothetical protein
MLSAAVSLRNSLYPRLQESMEILRATTAQLSVWGTILAMPIRPNNGSNLPCSEHVNLHPPIKNKEEPITTEITEPEE